ncbi:unnamed protein product [Urochloa decumbens]|uniref:Uncharacterized protein n=1 Tax=Urochloa decumbens TaxID=240449 RepID=A0ABC9B485_9POAL
MPTMATSSAEIMQAEAELCCHTIGYLKSTALHTAVKLGIPNIIHRHGGAASLSDLLAALPLLPPSKRPYLSRLMKVLAVAGIFTAEEDAPATGGEAAAAACVYRLNPMSRLLVDDDDDIGIHGSGGGGGRSLSPCVLVSTTPLYLLASLKFHQWLLSGESAAAAATPFAMAHGGDTFYGVAGRDEGVNEMFNEAMGASSQLLSGLVVRECGGVFAGVTSLVDVGGGDGTMARAIAEGFPHVKCSVLDLPQVVDGISSSPARDDSDTTVEFVAGDMMEFIPPADIVLLKYVLHNWSDEDCVKILKRCREAITKEGRIGKVVVIDTVIGSPSQKILEAQVLMDMCMMMLLDGKEREEQNWHRIFMEAGFSHYKIQPILGMRSVIEVYP